MATTDQELKTLNKTVTEAVNILKMYIGNSAQVKNMNEKEKAAIEGLLEVADEQKEQTKRQRAFTERERDEHGKFIKKREGSWGKFLDMAEATMKFADKMSFGAFSKMKGMVMGIASHFSKFFQEMKSQFLSLFGEESEWFALLGSIKDSIKGFMGSILSFLWQKTPNWAKKMIKYLHNMYLLQVKEFKKDMMDAGLKKGKGVSMAGLIGALIALLGGSIGAFLGRYFGFLSKLPIFNKIGKLFKSLESIPWLGKLLKAVKIGFKWIGWPLQLLLGLFDFIKAYKETEGTIWEKIKAGIWAALEGFIEMPVRLLTWAVEKVLGWFGIKFDGDEAADKIMGWVKKLFDFIVMGWESIFNLIKVEKDWIVGKLKEWTDLLLDAINPIINWIIDLWNNIIELAQDLLPDWMADDLEKFKGKHRGISETGQQAIRTEAEIKAEKAAQVKRDTKAIEKMGEGANTSQGVLNDLGRSIKSWMFNTQQNNNNGGGSGGDVQQIPDETDNGMIGFGNYAGGFQ